MRLRFKLLDMQNSHTVGKFFIIIIQYQGACLNICVRCAGS